MDKPVKSEIEGAIDTLIAHGITPQDYLRSWMTSFITIEIVKTKSEVKIRGY